MTSHNYEQGAKIKAAILKDHKEKTAKHLNFLKGFSEAWDKSSEIDPSEKWIGGANVIYLAYCKLHDLPELSADELILELNKI